MMQVHMVVCVSLSILLTGPLHMHNISKNNHLITCVYVHEIIIRSCWLIILVTKFSTLYHKTFCCVSKNNYLITTLVSFLKVAVNRKLQKFMHGLFILVLYIEVYKVILAILYCRASLVLLSQQIS